MRYNVQIINGIKTISSEDFNVIFDMKSGVQLTWGKTKEDDPQFCPIGPLIADIEITTICNNGCKYCYKNNTGVGENMSLATLTQLIDKVDVNKTLCQVAFGLGATGEENPDLWDMCRMLRERNIIPNGTVANISDATADKIVELFGACAVSYHSNKDRCYDSIKKLSDRGLKQTNMHVVIHSGNLEEVRSIIADVGVDKRLDGLNAIVLLSLKKKGRAIGEDFKPLAQQDFNTLIEELLAKKCTFGMDSCSSHKYMRFLDTTTLLTPEEKKQQLAMIEPCESFALFSSYFDVKGKYFPCSFAEGCLDGIDVLSEGNFVDDVWNGPAMQELRTKSLACKRECLLYRI